MHRCARCGPATDVHVRLWSLQTYPAALIGQNNPSKSTNELENESSIHIRPAHCEEKPNQTKLVDTSTHLTPNQNSPDSKTKPLKLDAAQTINSIKYTLWLGIQNSEFILGST